MYPLPKEMKTSVMLLESVLPVQTSRFTIRIWKHEASGVVDEGENLCLAQLAREAACEHGDRLSVAHHIAVLPNVSRVEVKSAAFIGDNTGIGVVLYKDRP